MFISIKLIMKKFLIPLVFCVIIWLWYLIYYFWMKISPFMILSCPEWTNKMKDYILWYETKWCENQNWDKVIAYYKDKWELAVWKYEDWIIYETRSYNWWFSSDENIVCYYKDNHETCNIYYYKDWKKDFLHWIKSLLSEWIWNTFEEWQIWYIWSNKCDKWPLEGVIRVKDYPPFGIYCNISDWESKKYYSNWQLEYYRKENEWVLEKMIHYYDNWQIEYEKEYIDEENLKQDVIYYNKDWSINYIEYINN